MLGSLILYLKGMRRMMFQLSGFYCRPIGVRAFFRVSARDSVVQALGIWGFLGFRVYRV